MESVQMSYGDEFLHIQAGAGGYGDPLEREPNKVLEDVQNELITSSYARDVYGVVIDQETVDESATAALRNALRKSGSYKSAYLYHFYDSIGLEPPAVPE